MDVFSLVKFWRNVGSTNLRSSGGYDSSIDDEESFFDLVFTNPCNEDDYDYLGVSRSSFRFTSTDEVYLNDKSNIFSFDSPNTKTTPPLGLMIEFQKSESKETNREIEEVKIGALLKRDNSLRHQLRTEKLLETDQTPSKRFSKDVVNKYLNMIKPSKRITDKSRLSEKSSTPSSSPASSIFSPRKEEKIGGGNGSMFREVRKRLGKSRSASAIMQTLEPKSDDSVLEQQDGIKGAILHCKRSYNPLSRSGSTPLKNQQRILVEEEKRCSI